jgi:hypothetical protein
VTGPLPHGGPEHHTYRNANGDIRCTACPLEVGRPQAMPDYSRAAMGSWTGHLRFRWARWRAARRMAKPQCGHRGGWTCRPSQDYPLTGPHWETTCDRCGALVAFTSTPFRHRRVTVITH